MSLEQSLDGLAEAIRAQTEFLKSMVPGTVPAPKKPVVKAGDVEAHLDAENKDVPEHIAKAAKAPAKAKADKPAPEAPLASTGESTVEYADVSKEVKALAGSGKRDIVLKVLEKYKVKTAQDLKPEQYAEFLVDLKSAAKPAEEDLA